METKIRAYQRQNKVFQIYSAYNRLGNHVSEPTTSSNNDGEQILNQRAQNDHVKVFAMKKAQYQKFINTCPVRLGDYGESRANLNKSADELASRGPAQMNSTNLTNQSPNKSKKKEGGISFSISSVPVSPHFTRDGFFRDTKILEA